MIKVDSVNFEMLAEPPIPEWVMRITAQGSGFVIRALPLIGEVGALPIEGLQIDLDGAGFSGYLVSEPEIGDVLHVGFPEGDLVDTGLTYQRPVV